MIIKSIDTPEEIEDCHEVFLELRPHLKNKQNFVDQVLSQRKEGYQIDALVVDEEIAACIGYRIMTMLAWGKILYIDDLITKEKHRGKKYGSSLLTHAINIAKNLGCDQVHLDTGYTRHAAHRVYLSHGFTLNCHHLALTIK